MRREVGKVVLVALVVGAGLVAGLPYKGAVDDDYVVRMPQTAPRSFHHQADDLPLLSGRGSRMPSGSRPSAPRVDVKLDSFQLFPTKPTGKTVAPSQAHKAAPPKAEVPKAELAPELRSPDIEREMAKIQALGKSQQPAPQARKQALAKQAHESLSGAIEHHHKQLLQSLVDSHLQQAALSQLAHGVGKGKGVGTVLALDNSLSPAQAEQRQREQREQQNRKRGFEVDDKGVATPLAHQPPHAAKPAPQEAKAVQEAKAKAVAAPQPPTAGAPAKPHALSDADINAMTPDQLRDALRSQVRAQEGAEEGGRAHEATDKAAQAKPATDAPTPAVAESAPHKNTPPPTSKQVKSKFSASMPLHSHVQTTAREVYRTVAGGSSESAQAMLARLQQPPPDPNCVPVQICSGGDGTPYFNGKLRDGEGSSVEFKRGMCYKWCPVGCACC